MGQDSNRVKVGPADRRHSSSSAWSSFPRRSLALAAIFALWMAAGVTRLVYLQIFQYGDFVSRAQRQQQRTIEVSPKRGIIFDRNFRELAMTVSVDSIFAVPSEIPSPETTSTLLARVLGVPSNELLSRMRNNRSFCWVKRRVDNLESERVRALNLKGIYFQKENRRFYPKRELAAHLLGYVGMDEQGLAGIELALDKTVRGRPGKLLIQTDARQRWYGRNERPPEPGENVVLTLDEKVQYIVERELAAAVAQTRSMAGTVVVMDPNNGEVLAMANLPTFNPNTYAQSPSEAWMNRAVAAVYEPGSTFKLVTVSGALEERLTRPDEVIDCQMGAITIYGHRIRDHKPFGLLDVTHVISNSSGVGAIKLGLRLGDERMHRYIRAFGFGAQTGIDLPGEGRGLLRPVERWSKISIGAISMGQEVAVTPLQLVRAVAAISNGGTLVRPHIVRKRLHPSTTQRQGLLFAATPSADDTATGPRVIRAETAHLVKQMMRQVVLSGTGKKAQLNGWSSAGKTGTAQKADPNTGAYSHRDYIASFSGFAPVNDPAIAMVVVLDSPRGEHGGGAVAAPVFKRIAEQVLAYLEVPNDLAVLPSGKEPEVDLAQLRDFAPSDGEDEDETPDAKLVGAAVPGATAAAGPRGVPPAPGTGAGNAAAPGQSGAPADSTVVVDLEGAPVVPSFLGKSVRAVAEQAVAMGLEVEMIGVGVARVQTPLPGSPLLPGKRIAVRFAR